jgi:tRNA threonylcarbamoyladenosine modification (KEOPS) complex  Pcc1 subunit
MPAQGSLVFDFDSPSEADAVEAALLPEMGADVPGSRAALHRAGQRITIEVAADDAGALRAAVNAYLRWVRTGLDVHRVARGP